MSTENAKHAREARLPKAAEVATAEGGHAQPPQKKKQKRNKPTLSCEECVERKTKCDRTRPSCLSCVKRQTPCKYSEIANIIAASTGQIRSAKIRKDKNASDATAANAVSPGLPSPSASYRRSGSTSSTNSSPFLLSNLQHTRTGEASVIGSGAQHPFANYWTTTGGVPEVIGVLPNKEQADSLVSKYFESVDPVYPMINKAQFLVDYDRFWSLSQLEKCKADPSELALQFSVYAMGAQFIQTESEQTRAQIAEFYVSAAHQSLRLYPFLSRTSLRSIQAMALIDYFLMNDNKATDAWAFGGILVRQAYAMGLNRDPNIIEPNASPQRKNQRRKVWQAVYFQDTFLTVLLKLPPTTTFSDCKVDSLTEDSPDSKISSTPMLLSPPPINMNPMSISNIAPRNISPTPPPPGRHTDIDYFRCMWQMADLVQQTICMPRALNQSLASSPQEKASLVGRYHDLYSTFPPSLTTKKRAEFENLLVDGGRMARQNLFLRSNFWHCLMLLEADESEAAGIRCNVNEALEAGRIAVNTFFDFWDFLRVDAGVWWVFQHRAFEEALIMSNLLAAYGPNSAASPAGGNMSKTESIFHNAKKDVRRMLDIVENVGSAAPEMQKTRTEVLRKAVEAIQW